jgi:Zn-dependent protease with chaperone function
VQVQGSTELELKHLALYGLTVALEVPAMIARYAAGLLVAAILLRVSGHEGASAARWAQLAALGPIAWSALALVTPKGGGWWWRQRLGGRAPSERERRVYESAIAQLQAGTSMPLRIADGWFVVDDPRAEAAVYGNTLMLSRGALELESRSLAALVAHQLGHLQGLDAKLTVAVNRLVIKPIAPVAQPATDPAECRRQTSTRGPSIALLDRRAENTIAAVGLTRWTAHKLTALLRGGLGLRLTAPTWAAIWREYEYEADRWAASIGQAQELADFLESHALKLDHPIPMVGLTSHTHPPTELRIDRLRASTHTRASQAAPGVQTSWAGEPT